MVTSATGDSTGNSPSDVATALERVISWLRDARETLGLSASALSALARLDANGPLRIADLVAHEGLSQPGMTTLINRLEEAELAVRIADPDDGRAVRVTITDEGRARVNEYRAARVHLIDERLALLPAADRRALESAVPALIRFTDPTATNHREKN
jgi:DNA-binding MarR family transcriptional regulator